MLLKVLVPVNNHEAMLRSPKNPLKSFIVVQLCIGMHVILACVKYALLCLAYYYRWRAINKSIL